MPVFLATFFNFLLIGCTQIVHEWAHNCTQVCFKCPYYLTSLLPESPAFTTACTRGRSPSNFPRLFPTRRAQLLLSGTKHWNYFLCVSEKLILWFRRDQVAHWEKHQTVQCTSVWFLNMVWPQPPASHFPSHAMGMTMSTLWKPFETHW